MTSLILTTYWHTHKTYTKTHTYTHTNKHTHMHRQIQIIRYLMFVNISFCKISIGKTVPITSNFMFLINVFFVQYSNQKTTIFILRPLSLEGKKDLTDRHFLNSSQEIVNFYKIIFYKTFQYWHPCFNSSIWMTNIGSI